MRDGKHNVTSGPAALCDLFSEGLRWALLARTRDMGMGEKGGKEGGGGGG